MVPITPDPRPSFRKMSARAKAKIVEGANANLRGLNLKWEKEAVGLKKQHDDNMKREKAKGARIIGKLKARLERDVRTATLEANEDAKYWRKRALASEERAGRLLENTKRLKLQVNHIKGDAAGLSHEAEAAKEKLQAEQ